MDLVQISEYVGLAGFILWAVVERGFTLLNQQQRQGQKQAQGSFWLISATWYGAMLFSILDVWTLAWTTFESPLWMLRSIGMLLTISGIAIRFLARRTLGKQYSVHVETSETHQLVTQGLYGLVRHPAYLGLLCLFLGIPLSMGSRGGFMIAAAGGIPAVVYRIRIEEQSMGEWFGARYEAYKESTWKLVPYLW